MKSIALVLPYFGKFPDYFKLFLKSCKKNKSVDFLLYTDCNMIFGNIRKFVTENILEQYQKIFSRGHLSLYRNNEFSNKFYKTQSIINYKEVYCSEKSFHFDEWGG